MIVDNIKKYANKRGMTVAEVERRAGIAKNCVYKWKCCAPKVSTLQKVADVLEVSISELIEG